VLRLIHEPQDDYSQSRWVTRMARLAANEGADWVINSDADEFWWPQDAPDLPTAFASLPQEVGVVRVPRHNFPPQAPDDRPFFERMTLRDLDSRNTRGRPLRPKVVHRAHPQVEVGMGNHGVSAPGGLGDRSRRSGIEILHFPLRTYQQFENKIAKGGRALASNTELPKGKVQTWRELYERWQQGGLRDFYAGEMVDPAAAPPGFVEDTRLRDFLRGLQP
jgi:hypothetical protein